MSCKPQTLHTKTLARTRLFHIEAVGLRFSNGVEVEFERICSGAEVDAVLVVPVLPDGRVLLIREYSAGTDRYELCLPEGRVEPGESCLIAAHRELREEAGYGARRLTPLRQLSIAPSYLSHATQLILAEDLYLDRLAGDEPEAIEVLAWPLDELPALLAQPELTEARSIAALFIAMAHLNGARAVPQKTQISPAPGEGCYHTRGIYL
jgi:ADP-ribose diphosphatase